MLSCSQLNFSWTLEETRLKSLFSLIGYKRFCWKACAFPIMAMGRQKCIPFSWTILRGKHSWRRAPLLWWGLHMPLSILHLKWTYCFWEIWTLSVNVLFSWIKPTQMNWNRNCGFSLLGYGIFFFSEPKISQPYNVHAFLKGLVLQKLTRDLCFPACSLKIASYTLRVTGLGFWFKGG